MALKTYIIKRPGENSIPLFLGWQILHLKIASTVTYEQTSMAYSRHHFRITLDLSSA